MGKKLSAGPWKYRGQKGALYICKDKVCVNCRYRKRRINANADKVTDKKDILGILRNGILLRHGELPTVVVNGKPTDRDMKKIISGGPGKMYAFPKTITIVGKSAFEHSDVVSVRLNEGLKILEEECFSYSKIKRFALPSSVEFVGDYAFQKCENLKFADLSAAHGLKTIEQCCFLTCKALKQVLLNDGLETIGKCCFKESGPEEIAIPGSVTHIDQSAFAYSSLAQVRFLGTSKKEPHCEHSSGNGEDNCSEETHQLVIGERAFTDCDNLKQIIFDPGSTVTEIQLNAFFLSGLESFTAPPSLRKIGALAFSECHNLKTFQLNEGIQELEWLCLLGTGVTDLRLPPHIKMTREQLGLDQDPKELRLPHGLEIVGAEWFKESNIEKLFIPNTVQELGEYAFTGCLKLCEIIFEPGSELKKIGRCCFLANAVKSVVIPKSVQYIGERAFYGCSKLNSLTFEKGIQLAQIGKDMLKLTPLHKKNQQFPVRRGQQWHETLRITEILSHVNGNHQ